MQFNQVGINQTAFGGPEDPLSYPKDPNKRRSGLELIRTVRIADNTSQTNSWLFTRIDVDIPEANFVRYKEILFSFNGGFLPGGAGASDLNCFFRKYGVLDTNNTVYFQGFAPIATTTTTNIYTNTNAGGYAIIAPVTNPIDGAAIVRNCDIYINQFGFRSDVFVGKATTLATGSQYRTHGHFTNQSNVRTGGTLPYYLETDYPGVSLQAGGGQQMYGTGYGSSNGLECNIYGFVR